MKYISIKMDPNGSIPEAGMIKYGCAYHGQGGLPFKPGIIRSTDVILHEGLNVPEKLCPMRQPRNEIGIDINTHIANMYMMTVIGMALIDS